MEVHLENQRDLSLCVYKKYWQLLFLVLYTDVVQYLYIKNSC